MSVNANLAHRVLIESITRLQRVQREAGADAARSLDCSRTSLTLLWLLEHTGGLGVGDIATRLRVDISVASRQVTALVESGFAERTTPDGPGTDRRVRSIRLTDAGRAFTADTRRLMDERAQALFADWTSQEIADAAYQLNRISDALASFSEHTDHSFKERTDHLAEALAVAAT